MKIIALVVLIFVASNSASPCDGCGGGGGGGGGLLGNIGGSGGLPVPLPNPIGGGCNGGSCKGSGGLLSGVIKGVGGATKSVGGVVKAVGGVVKTVSVVLQKVTGVLGDVLNKVVKALANGLQKVLEAAGKLVGRLAGVVKTVVKVVIKAVTNIAKAFQSLSSGPCKGCNEAGSYDITAVFYARLEICLQKIALITCVGDLEVIIFFDYILDTIATLEIAVGVKLIAAFRKTINAIKLALLAVIKAVSTGNVKFILQSSAILAKALCFAADTFAFILSTFIELAISAQIEVDATTELLFSVFVSIVASYSIVFTYVQATLAVVAIQASTITSVQIVPVLEVFITVNVAVEKYGGNLISVVEKCSGIYTTDNEADFGNIIIAEFEQSAKVFITTSVNLSTTLQVESSGVGSISKRYIDYETMIDEAQAQYDALGTNSATITKTMVESYDVDNVYGGGHGDPYPSPSPPPPPYGGNGSGNGCSSCGKTTPAPTPCYG